MNNIDVILQYLLNAEHPIGSLYWSSVSTDPHDLFGGTWTQIKDKFILAAGDTYKAGNTGGYTDATLPSHYHDFSQVTWGGSSGKLHYEAGGSISGSGSYYPYISGGDRNYFASTEAKGDSASGKNMPPYIVMYCWQRTA